MRSSCVVNVLETHDRSHALRFDAPSFVTDRVQSTLRALNANTKSVGRNVILTDANLILNGTIAKMLELARGLSLRSMTVVIQAAIRSPGDGTLEGSTIKSSF